MFCKYCGNVIPDDSVFCKHCGRKVIDENRASSSVQDEVLVSVNCPSEHIVSNVLTIKYSINRGGSIKIKNPIFNYDVYKLIGGPYFQTKLDNNNKEFTEISYAVQTVKCGDFEIPPICVKYNETVYVSRSQKIHIKTINTAYKPKDYNPEHKPNENNTVQLKYVALGFLCVILVLAFFATRFDESKSRTPVEKIVPSSWEETVLNTGDIPFDGYSYLFNLDSYSVLEVVNHTGKDAVVLLCDENGHVVRNNYIKSGDTFPIRYIPTGMYTMKTMLGNGWNAQKDNGANNPQGGFMNDVSYTKSARNESFDFYPVETFDGVEYPSYSVTLHKVKDGNFRTESINKDGFFK